VFIFVQFLLAMKWQPTSFNNRVSLFFKMNIMNSENKQVLSYSEKAYFQDLFYPLPVSSSSSSSSSSLSSSSSSSSSSSNNQEDPVPLPPSHTDRGKPIPKSTVALRALLKDLSEKELSSWDDLTAQLGKGYRDLSTEDEVMLLHKSLIKFSRAGASPEKNIDSIDLKSVGAFGKFQIKSHAKYFMKLITLAVTQSKRACTCQRYIIYT